MSFNKVILLGNIGRDPELRYSDKGLPICSFTMATNERRRDRAGEQQDITTWFRPVFFGKQAETIAQHFQKGDPIYVEGRMHVSEWTDRDGKARHTLEVNGSDFQFVGARNGNGNGEGNGVAPKPPAAQASVTAPEGDIEDDDLPF